MNRLNIDDEVKIFMPGYRVNGRIVKVQSIQKLSDNTILYTGMCTEKVYGKVYGKVMFGEFIQFKEDQYKIINHKGNDFVEDDDSKVSIVLKLQNTNNLDELLKELKEQVDKLINNLKL